MQITRTIKVRLKVDQNQLQPTFDAYTKAFNHVCEVGWNDSDSNSVSLHMKTYRDTRQYLPSQLACSARMKATEALKSTKQAKRKEKKISCPVSKHCSIRLDANSFNVWFDKNLISILTVNGRLKVPIVIPEYAKQYLTWRRASADLFERDGKALLHICFIKDIHDPIATSEVLGVDRGIVNIAVSSNNKFYTGKEVRKVRTRYQKLKSALQSKNTKSAKRHLGRLKSKENRFMTDVNHCISKKIVHGLKPGTTIVFEDLKGITERSKGWRKTQKTEVHRWAFFQLEYFTTYKANFAGCVVDHGDARYTSQKCSRCGHIERGNRASQGEFHCKKCGFRLHADLNSSRNIRQNHLEAIRLKTGLPVNQPIVPSSNTLVQVHSPKTVSY
jgi:IS605 OrfB family transposase